VLRRCTDFPLLCGADIRIETPHDVALAEKLFYFADENPEFEARCINLSIATFRCVPADLEITGTDRAVYLDKLNSALLAVIQKSGEIFISNAVIDGDYPLRACI
jgi:hypothetical protein